MAKYDVWLTYGVSVELPDGIDENSIEGWNIICKALQDRLSTIPTDEIASESQWEIELSPLEETL